MVDMTTHRAKYVAWLALGLLGTMYLVFVGPVVASDLPQASRSGYPVNASGLTFGSSADALTPEAEPDLIQVEATNGRTGYSYRTDLEGPVPSSPAEALRMQAERGDATQTVPVYLEDGTTQIGVFVFP